MGLFIYIYIYRKNIFFKKNYFYKTFSTFNLNNLHNNIKSIRFKYSTNQYSSQHYHFNPY